MKYKDGKAFRQALEKRLLDQSRHSGIPLVRLRKMVAFDRFLARLAKAQQNDWILKGGLALQLRLGKQARTTKDIDLFIRIEGQNLYDQISQAVLINLGDWFSFEISQAVEDSLVDPFGGIRFLVQSLLDGRTFEKFHVDVGVDDPIIEPLEVLATPALLEFAELSPTRIPCSSLEQQIAEKLHAYTQLHPSGRSSRIKDFVDILLIAGIASIYASSLLKAIHIIFETRSTHPIPPKLMDPPSDWSGQYRRLADELELEWDILDDAVSALRVFIKPILEGDQGGSWDPISWQWSFSS